MIDLIYQQPFPTIIVDDHYKLRLLDDNDAQDYFNYYEDGSVGRYILATDPRSLTEAKTEIQYCRNLFRHKRGFYWGLANRETNQMIGAVGLYSNNFHHRAELCYDLSKQYWRQGIMSKALEKTLDFCFREANFQRIEAVTMPENEGSIATLLKLGFSFEGVLRSYRYFEGGFYDVNMYAITTSEYQSADTTKSKLDQLFDNISDKK